MLRNLLYSLFLHFIVLVLIYLNAQDFYYYNLQTLFEKRGKPVKINLIDVSELNKSNKPLPQEPIIKQKPIIKEEEKIIPPKQEEEKVEPKKEPTISAEKIAESVKQKPTKAEEVIENYEYIKKPDTPPKKEDVLPEDKNDSTLDDIINETTNPEESDDEKVYADETEPVEMEEGEDIKNVVNLSIRERANIQRQIRSCYKMAILKSGVDSTTKVTLQISLKKDGNINMKEVVVLNEDKYTYKSEEERRSFEIAVENAKTALVFCSPLRNLPDNKYMVWKEMSLEFDSNKIEVVE